MKIEIEKLIGELEELKDSFEKIAFNLRTSDPEMSYRSFHDSELIRGAVEELKRNIPQEMEIEGGGSTWWYVCPECHGAINSFDSFCSHCGQAVKD